MTVIVLAAAALARDPVPPPVDRPYLLGEYERLDALLLPSWTPELAPSFVGIVEQAHAIGLPVTVCSRDPDAEAASRASLVAAGLEGVSWADCPLDTVWMRDYGPLFAQSADLERMLADAAYLVERPRDDAFPEIVASWDGDLRYAVPLALDGGNLLPDGQGTCVSSTMVAARSGHDMPTLDGLFADFFGCDRMVWLEPIPGEPTGHVDVFTVLVDRDLALVGAFEPEARPAEAAAMDRDAALLEAAGFAVERIPMPEPRDLDGDGDVDFPTHLNGVHLRTDLGHRYLVPVYADVPDVEEAALAAITAAMSGVEVVPVDATSLVRGGGALHCVTRPVPSLDWPHRCTDGYTFDDVGTCAPDLVTIGPTGCASGAGVPSALLALAGGLGLLRPRRHSRPSVAARCGVR